MDRRAVVYPSGVLALLFCITALLYSDVTCAEAPSTNTLDAIQSYLLANETLEEEVEDEVKDEEGGEWMWWEDILNDGNNNDNKARVRRRDPLTVIWTPHWHATEHEWIDDWVLSKVKRPIIKIHDSFCPPNRVYSRADQMRRDALRHAVDHNSPDVTSGLIMKNILWIVYGPISNAGMKCFEESIIEHGKAGARIGLLHLSDEFGGSLSPTAKCNETEGRMDWCASNIVDLYYLDEVKYVIRNHWSLRFNADPVIRRKVRWIPLGVTAV